ncbi:MAG TPA: DNA polymerase I [Candidatus Omnitrophota bacterium]|nr:DNA polymerase I [Candidatus Omnitrophota bacterium]HNQ50509.1 DNA polymerase I [Candidatus Omnitrophota bacterium]HQO38090.1 DNA polymerase I [Candidatus Omnitrophota bacterium]HQQ06064.1 DNA polymerase I [Candidatus Omnitrophota bacterium]
MGNATVFLIDATALCYRAFYAIRGLTTSKGEQTNAIFGFVRMLRKLIKDHKPVHLAVCFDVSRETFRQKKFAAYKAQREAMPDGLSGQIPVIKDIVAAYGIPLFEQAGFEADDIIATLSHKAKKQGVRTVVISADKDLLQLVDEDIAVLNPQDAEGMYDTARVKEKIGLAPAQIPDLIAFVGDTADNIPGIRGITAKKAVALLAEYGSAEQVVQAAGRLPAGKLRQAIEENARQIALNKELAVLDDRMDLAFSLDSLAIKEPDVKKLARIFTEYELKAFLKDLPASAQPALPAVSAEFIVDKDMTAACAPGALYVAGAGLDSLSFGSGDRIFRVEKAGPGVKHVLADPAVSKVGHDLKKLAVALAADGVELNGIFFDTMIAGYLLNPARSNFALEDIAWEYLKETPATGGEPLDSAAAVGLVRRMHPLLERALRDNELITLFETLEMPLVRVLAQIEMNGIRLDCARLKQLSGELEQKIARLIRDIYGLCGCEFNLNSPKQLREVLFEKLQLPAGRRTKTGPSTDEEVLRGLAERHEFPRMLLEYRQLMKLKSTYVDALPLLVNPLTDRLHTTLNQTGTQTGRLSSSNPNLQNIPVKTELGRSIREAIVAFSPDSMLVSFDYSQIELRILAHMSGDEELIKAFRDDADVHRRTAALVYGCAESDVTGEMRSAAKRINFGIVYGLSAYGLSRDLSIPIAAAQQFIDAYFATYPGVKAYIDDQIAKAKQDGFVATILGRRRYLPEIKDRNIGVRQFAERQAVNAPIQGSASDMIKLAMVRLSDVMRMRGIPARMILQIHDELLFDVPQPLVMQVAALVRDIMEHAIELVVPVKVDVAQGPNWNRMENMGTVLKGGG